MKPVKNTVEAVRDALLTFRKAMDEVGLRVEITELSGDYVSTMRLRMDSDLRYAATTEHDKIHGIRYRRFEDGR